MKKDLYDTILNIVMTVVIAGVVYELIYLKTHVFEFKFVDFLFVFCLYEFISIKKMLRRIAESALNYATYFKFYFDVKKGQLSVDDLKGYFENLKKEMEKNKNA